ncbi:hypothetical protein FE391_20165 [Nonomuraea sp. KC401]|uniref:hypothetical protein n=1 Tax=unclassified Nonomuraea TaxID=2593643 RepID=UPI0010FCFA86|nr:MULTISPECIES: hypothetical protein [unclassified Nonomuraea]NBE95198.1 hypothetical protein [Nonomuraea sp. K271]TLF71171.1 hypothetical protein FE391_20165 [Nonomuraea sp. KC401]
MSVTQFAGVTKDEHRGVTSKAGLYEFWTEDGAHVYLHDTDFRRLTYQPGRPPMLEFVYGPQWAPSELLKTPVVVFRFEDVRLVEWCEDQEGHDCVTAHPDALPGQVDLFDWDGADLFSLYTFRLYLTFHASRADVTVRAE